MALDQKLVACMLGSLAAFGAWAQDDSPFTQGRAKGKISHAEINEASGLVTSVKNPGFLWTHNDSGDAARIFLIDDSAQLKATYYLQGVTARDWEDIGTMARSERNYLLVGDIGDNGGRRPYIKVHRIEEPVMHRREISIDTIPREHIATYVLKYEDGPRDAESLFFDPIDNYLYVISKRELRSGIYRTVFPETPTDTLVLKHVGTLPHTFITSADLSEDGTEILMKNLLNVFYWQRSPGESIPQSLKRPAVRLPYRPEPQGEAVAFSRDGRGYYTLSEAPLGFTAILYFYPRQSNH
ncbi:hypothetical protein [Parapedobacter sp. GCM10030251]|uniref:hypothetical protein n=1 Tax=Parapedobacter sp. GCM10030251 TaxID=3273419 RepID=UPI00366E5413